MKKIYTFKHLFFLCFLFIFSGVLSAQGVSNVQYEYSCPCKVKVTYDLAKAGDVALSYSIDNINWLPADTFYSKTAGTQLVDVWDCEADNKVYGLFYFKLERVMSPCEQKGGEMINGVCWATRNVDAPGTFAVNPEDAGMFYQWNRNIGWSNTDPLVNSNGGTTWDPSDPPGVEWQTANDPSPTGFRVPNRTEINALCNTTYVNYAWTTENGVIGERFTDKSSGNSIFIPGAGFRGNNGDLTNPNADGRCWTTTQNGTTGAYVLIFSIANAAEASLVRHFAFSVRPVVE